MSKGVPNKRYTPGYKKQVIETMQRERLSYSETARQFEVNDHHRIQEWERIYLTEGPEGFAVERRGRGGKGSAKLPQAVEEDLLKEVQRLRAENAYLKKLQAFACRGSVAGVGTGICFYEKNSICHLAGKAFFVKTGGRGLKIEEKYPIILNVKRNV